jgi:hypothetical protein
VLTGNFPADEARIRQAIEAVWIQVVPAVPEGLPLPDLDEGEAACICLALAQQVLYSLVTLVPAVLERGQGEVAARFLPRQVQPLPVSVFSTDTGAIAPITSPPAQASHQNSRGT